MELAPFDPFRELSRMQDRISRFFDDAFPVMQSDSSLLPAMDMYQEGSSLIVETALPGFKEEEVDVKITDSTLEIKAEHSTGKEDADKDRKYIMKNLSTTKFYRQISLPKGADWEKADASFGDGVLKIVLPMKELPQPRRLMLGRSKS